jgi:hypothetical protein
MCVLISENLKILSLGRNSIKSLTGLVSAQVGGDTKREGEIQMHPLNEKNKKS